MIVRPLLGTALAALLLGVGTGCTAGSGGERNAAPTAASASPSAVAACAHRPGDAFPHLLGGFDERLAKEPTDTGGTADPKELTVTVLIQGTCATVNPGQTVTINYVCVTLRDGKVFDDDPWRRRSAVDVQVGLAQLGQTLQVIEGLDRGLAGVKVGSRVQLDVPPQMAFDAITDPPPGAPRGPVRFIVDVLDVRD
ncbi:FKBP-type peptidyl-prolyl cis-trans isomerase [Dactylosporangium sp. NPDC048998]|uniref:FKBP-type peptidyl-prolyl cis-trans isomerase n=1 Tax=Dactylosporangium sp. NPDC048998 TaxID=3363976 RepID=UPI003710B421